MASKFTFVSAGIFCIIALLEAIIDGETTLKVSFHVLPLAASLLLVSAYKGYKYVGETKGDSSVRITPFSEAGLFSKMLFWWLNPLMSLGREKTLEEGDLSKLRQAERADSCYFNFVELSKKRSSMVWTLASCYRREILVSGLFALLKTLTLSTGPLLLKAFIQIVEGETDIGYKGYILVLLLLISKMVESISHRQWYFQSQLVGLKVRSTLIALIYKKQLRLSNTAKMMHSGGEIMTYVTVDVHRIGELSLWFHQCWTTLLQLCVSVVILVHSVGIAAVASLIVIILTVLCNTPLAKLELKFQTKLMSATDERLKATSEALTNMKVLKLYAWESHVKKSIEDLREREYRWLSRVQYWKAYNLLLFWTCPVLVSAATFGVCYFLGIPLHASNVFTFVATLRLVQEPIRCIPDVIEAVIDARVALSRVMKFLEAPELQIDNFRKKNQCDGNHAIVMKSASLSWELNSSRPIVRNINLKVRPGEKVVVCGEVGSGKSTLLAAILGEVPYIEGSVEVYGKIAYVPQTAWIQTGTLQENILFGSTMDDQRYKDTLRRCSLLKDLEVLPYGDMTEIGERGINLSGGQKQRIQLARALYQDADLYLLDDPFSALDAHTASSLFREYIMDALSEKTVLLVTHQVDFLPSFHCCVYMSSGEILRAGEFPEILASTQEFKVLVNAHKETAGADRLAGVKQHGSTIDSTTEIKNICSPPHEQPKSDQIIKQEVREKRGNGVKPYLLYLNQNKGYLYLTIAALAQVMFVTLLALQNSWMASSIDNPLISTSKVIVVYLILGLCSIFFLLIRALSAVTLGLESSKSLFAQLLNSLFRAPMSFYDSTPLGRIMTRVSSDLGIVDLDIPFSFLYLLGCTGGTYSAVAMLVSVTWQVLLVCIPVMYLVTLLQRYYFTTAKELMGINGTTKSLIANHLTESMAGAVTIRAFEEEDRFFSKNLDLIDTNASPVFHSLAAKGWLIQRVETLSATMLTAAALCMVLLPPRTFSSGFIGMLLSYGLSLNASMNLYVQYQCILADHIVSVERLNQYMHIPCEAPEIIEDNRPSKYWPLVGKVEICDLQIRYRPDTPLVLGGISCTFEGGDKIGIVGRTGSGKTTLIQALFRIVEPSAGKIIIDGIDISTIGLHDLRTRIGIIPQDPTLFSGTVKFNLDPLSQHTEEDIWQVLDKCQLKELVQEKEHGLDSLVVDEGSNWSRGQRQLFCLGRALLRKSRVLILDEATASIDNTTDMILQKIIRAEFADCTVITVAHRIPTVMDCTKVLSISDGKLLEFDDPMNLLKNEGSLFGQLVKEYWSRTAESH